MKSVCSCHDDAHYSQAPLTADRRQFLKIAAFGAGVAIYSTIDPTGPARASGGTEALLLSCMDYRLVDDTTRYMDGRHLTNGYDQVMIAGASLGAITDKFTEWNKTFWDHVQVALDLHHIKKVIILDHRDCGAYRVVYGIDFGKDPAAETIVHTEHLRKLAAMIKAKYPALEVETALMALDGSVEAIPAA